MTDAQPNNIFARSDTFFGVCEAIGQDFGFNPNWLRVAFAVPLIYSPTLAIAAYIGVGIIVVISRFAFPRKVGDTSMLVTDAQSEAPASAAASETADATYAHAA